jgi:histidinol-phosphatase
MPAVNRPDLDRVLDVARRCVRAAAEASLPHFESGIRVERKADRSPVTAADRASEAAILRIIQEAFPTHAILAEESGAHSGDEANRWIVDPLDGTRGFSRGGVFWGPLVAFEQEGEVVVGAMAMPALGQHYWAAKGRGAFKNGAPLRVSNVSELAEATISVGELGHLLSPPFAPSVLELIRSAASTRGLGDPAGCAMLLEGRADVWLEAGVKTWDIAAHKILIEEAGGRFTSLDGLSTIELGHCVGSNGKLHDDVLAVLAAASSKATSDIL